MDKLTHITLIILVALCPAVVLHEYAHAWVANKLGDPTARLGGRLTINPLKHVDPIGTLFIPGLIAVINIFNVSTHIPMFGWAKPVPVNFLRLHNPKRDMILVALAGPAVNIILVLLFSQLFRINLPENLYPIISSAILLNLGLAVFNLIPIPPLDGSRVVMGLLPNKLSQEYGKLEPYGILIIMILVYSGYSKFLIPIIIYLVQILRLPYPVINQLAGMMGMAR